MKTDESQGWSSRYQGPCTRSTFVFAGRSVVVDHPKEPDRLLNDIEVVARNQQDDYMPYWAFLWPGAFFLAEVLASAEWTGREVALEIGCGVGLGGLAGLRAGLGKVVFTDYDEAPLPFVASSAHANGIAEDRYETRRLDWRALPDEQYDLIIGADVLYERRLVPLVVNLLQRMLTRGGEARIAGPYRVASEEIEPTLIGAGFRVETRPVESVDERGMAIRGFSHRIWR